MTGHSWVTHADQNRWQQQASRELAATLDAWLGPPPIAWAVSTGGCGWPGPATM